MSRHNDYQKLLDQGRKAGLNTQELYSAMSARPSEGSDLSPGQTDGNGYVSSYDSTGRLVFHPVDPNAR
jgi:hypothetical protein